MSQSEVIEAQLQQAQQERIKILSELEQLKQLQVQLKSQLDQVLSLVKPLEGLQLFDPGVLQSQLLEIQEQLRSAQKERTQLSDFQSQTQSNLQSQLSEILSQLEKSHKERSQEDELISVRGVDYTRLRDLLAAGKWQQADRETKFVMLKVAGIGQEGKLDKELLKNFSCGDLRTIDQLWVKYSNGHFGFSVQKWIFERVGGKPGVDDYKAYCGFGEQVGWLVKNCWLSESDLKFTLNASCGHLPVTPFLTLIRGIRSRKLYFCDFFSRIETSRM